MAPSAQCGLVAATERTSIPFANRTRQSAFAAAEHLARPPQFDCTRLGSQIAARPSPGKDVFHRGRDARRLQSAKRPPHEALHSALQDLARKTGARPAAYGCLQQ
jgi:hypothetical protein